MSSRGRICTALLSVWVGVACGSSNRGPQREGSIGAPAAGHGSGIHASAGDDVDGAEVAEPASNPVWFPSVTEWKPEVRVSGRHTLADQADRVAVIEAYRVPLYARPGDKYEIGQAYRGAKLPAKPVSSSRRCKGAWYRVSGGAHLCTSDGARIVTGDELEPPVVLGRGIDLDRPLPFSYVKAEHGAPRLDEVPSADQVQDIKRGRVPSSLVDRWLKGTYLLAAVASKTVGDEELLRTPDDRWVLKPHTTPKPLPPMHGEMLREGPGLPIAFLHETAPVVCAEPGAAAVSECGELEQHARFVPASIVSEPEQVVMIDDRRGVRRGDVRIAETIERPKGVSKKAKWIHINLSEQTLVAYEGDQPVYATLVSTGKPGHDTEPGLWRTDRKFVSKTMRGKDEDGPYSVGEVPWTMYYDGNYAVHGAYWHNEFGRTRSHGCVNIPPIDARWLFLWDENELPAGWYAMFHRLGSFVYITGSTPPDEGKSTK